MKVIKIGRFRILLMIAVALFAIVSGYTYEPIAFLILGLFSLGWIILEVYVVLQLVLRVIQILSYLMKPADKSPETNRQKQTKIMHFDTSNERRKENK